MMNGLPVRWSVPIGGYNGKNKFDSIGEVNR